MPRIKIPGLSTYVPGEGFGSDIITPTLPSFTNLQRLNLYGTAYSSEMDDSKVKYFPSVSGLPTGQSIGQFGMVNENKRAGSGVHSLDSVLEPSEGTLFFLLMTNASDSDYSSATLNYISGQGRLAAGVRFRSSNAISATQPWEYAALNISSVTSNDSSGVISTPSAAQITANEDGRVIMIAVTKDKVSQEATSYNYSRDYSAALTSPAALVGTVPLAVSFGVTGDNPEITMLAAGYYNTVLSASEMYDLWLTMKKTVGSAGAPV